ncbi:MAG: hypothetical protein V5A38_10095 [Halolamina sp.]|uniref:hypothetical protein n=1 Tax=Halolamina sp. TaxID=1940283 RepID=UPI002FC3327E
MPDDSPSQDADVELPDIEVSEDHVGKPVLSPETMIVGVVTGVSNNAYTVDRDEDADFSKLSMGLVSSGDGKLAVMPGQVEKITEDGVYLK